MEAVSTSSVIDTDYIACKGKRIDEIPLCRNSEGTLMQRVTLTPVFFLGVRDVIPFHSSNITKKKQMDFIKERTMNTLML